MAPCGRVLPAKIIFLDLLLGKMTVEAGAATRLMVVFFGSPAKELTATGMAVATSVPSGSDFISSKMFAMLSQ
jgi:hypothetical protein